MKNDMSGTARAVIGANVGRIDSDSVDPKPAPTQTATMKKILIAFDVDGTLRNNTHDEEVVANERIRDLLIILASFKNVRIMVWSGGGELYARQVANALGIAHYVDLYADKRVSSCEIAGCRNPNPEHWHFVYDGPQPDIAIDDIQSFSLGKINLIVREK